MENMIKTIAVFASSANDIDEIYFKDAKELGEKLANAKYNLVYGGSTLGLMGEITRAANKKGCEITGVMPEKLYNFGLESPDCTKFILTKGMRERKAKMDELTQAVVAIAGGFGTLEEISEMIVQKQLGYNNKPIIFLNTNNFYNHLIDFFEKIINDNFASKNSKNLYYIANTPDEVISYLENYKFEEINYLNGKLKITK